MVLVVALFAISLLATGMIAPDRRDAPVLSMVLLHILSAFAPQLVQAGPSAVLASTSVLWAPLGAARLVGEKLSLWRVVGLGLGVLGLIAIFNPVTFDWSDRSAAAGNAALAAGRHAVGCEHRAQPQPHLARVAVPTRGVVARWRAILTVVAVLVGGWPVIVWTVHSILLLFAGIGLLGGGG